MSLCVLCVYKLSKVHTHTMYRLAVDKSSVPTFAVSRLHNNGNVKVGVGT